MTVLLDTDLLAERERADAVHAAYADQSPRRTVVVGPGPVRHHVERVGLGDGAHLLRTGGSPLDIVRTARQVRGDADEHVALGLRRRGRGVVSAGATESDMPVGQLNCVDMTRPYRLTHTTANTHDVLILSNRVAGVPVDVVRAALPALAGSPVYDLVRGHLGSLFTAARALSPEVRALTGQATVALVRALLTTAAEVDDGRGALEEALPTRIALYVDAHLTDRGLTVQRLAEAHHISVRHLYNVWAAAGHSETPAQWIISRRLGRARELLAVSGEARTSIATVARRSGFSDTSHFARRFRESSGMSPSEWREARSST
ncbi:AraC family transcriptional regulator [Microlunatus capsulatus]|uniref:AraC-like DNA-binding protein n=1 Tax=Microlunatus capsulatus TaxID=99117 RepID=A0ABS4Z3Z0_9ACTN|nr:AraC family transcriptional regulator [Microlunatus capsulatus]MBP2415694.1 AraC-like DNA-binding protein [Microlunatus capsulatus]